MLPRRCIAVFTFIMLKTSFSLDVSEKADNNEEKGSHAEELFGGRIEAPNKTHILDNLFKGYDKRVRPYYREKPVPVSLYAGIDSFHDIKEEQMEYKVEVVLKEHWKDPRLAYGNASWFVRLKGDTLAKVWYPDTIIENSRKLEVDDKTRTAYLFGDGTIFLSEWIKATLTSHMEFHKYPMDVQTLKIQFAAYSYDDSQVKYRWSKVSLTEKDMTEFHVEKQTLRMEATSFITGTHTAAIAEFEIKRRLQYYILEFYIPCMASTFASWIQFWMDVTAIGDRAGLGITTVLTEIFLLQFGSQGMPKVSYMKAVELYVIVSFGFIFFALVESAVVYKASSWTLMQNKEDRGSKGQDDKNQQVGVHATEAKSPRLLQASTNDAFVFKPRVSPCLELTLQDLPESEGGEPSGDPSPPTASIATSNLGLMIDRGARIIFPFTYALFTIAYFVFI